MPRTLTIVSVILLFLSSAASAQSPEDARQKLRRRGIRYSPREFTERAWRGDAEAVSLFLASGMDPNVIGFKGGTALMCAADGGHVEIVEILLDAGADVDEKENDGRTSLILAAWLGEADVVRILLDAGAKLSTRAQDGTTALMRARAKDYTEIVELLIEAGAEE